MKNMFRFSALLCAMALFVTSCTKDETAEPFNPTPVTGEIQFGARAGFENSNPDSRTVYSGETYEIENSNGTKTKYERINWVNGTDLVQIYYDKGAEGNNTVSYKIVEGKETDANGETTTTFSYLQKMSTNGLQWDSGEGDHTFYAMYPAPEMITESTLAQGVKMNGTTLNGYVPTAQAPKSIDKTITNGKAHYVGTPDMTYAYMAAKATVERPQSSVSLTFVPIVTAVEIELEVPTEVEEGTEGSTGEVVPVQIGEIQVVGTGIAGAFTADLSTGKWTDTYPTCSDVTGNAASDVIQITTYVDNLPITLNAGETLTFTVFLRPNADIEDLKVNISPTGAGYVGKSIPVTITKHKKTIISNVKLPAVGVAIDASKWMSQLDPNTKIQKLSLPGTGGTFSYAYNGDDPDFYKQQTLTFEEQWAAGIRAFEIVCDRPSNASTSLANQNVDCNKESVNTKVGTVLTNLLTKTATIKDSKGNPSECAVLILTYQPHGASPSRNASSFASSLKAMWNGLNDTQKAQIVQYTPDMTIGDAAGKVMIFARVNQREEKDGGNFATATNNIAGTNITLIDGCGTGKDRWGARGYLINGARAADISNSASDYLEKYMTTNDYQLGTGATKGEADFSFNTNDAGITVWYQEWARVIPQDTYKASGTWGSGWFGGYSYPAIYWFESYNEKLQNAKDTFLKAINSQVTDKTIYINSLCGYLAGTDFPNSLVPSVGSAYGGDGGNVKALADKLNPAFYQSVLQSGMEQATGPTGIVLMDYVKATPSGENDGGYYLPGVIIANNFKFTANNNQSGSGNTGGGNTDQEKPGGGDGDGDGDGTGSEG